MRDNRAQATNLKVGGGGQGCSGEASSGELVMLSGKEINRVFSTTARYPI